MNGNGPESPVAIIGGGAAGISTANWLRDLHITPTLFERASLGGILHRVHNAISDHPPGKYQTGVQLGETLGASLTVEHVAADVRELSRDGGEWFVTTDQRRHGPFPIVVVATGIRYRALGVPGETEGYGDYISQSASLDGPRVAGQTVAVIGGGDAALENALILAEHDCRVSLFSRSPFSARDHFVEDAKQQTNITLMPLGLQATGFKKTDDGCLVSFNDGSQHAFACVFIRVGVEPVYPDLRPSPSTRDGYLSVDAKQRTDIGGMFAVGDVTDTALRSVSTSIGDGAKAAKEIWRVLNGK